MFLVLLSLGQGHLAHKIPRSTNLHRFFSPAPPYPLQDFKALHKCCIIIIIIFGPTSTKPQA